MVVICIVTVNAQGAEFYPGKPKHTGLILQPHEIRCASHTRLVRIFIKTTQQYTSHTRMTQHSTHKYPRHHPQNNQQVTLKITLKITLINKYNQLIYLE
jgi:hypothetical protein